MANQSDQAHAGKGQLKRVLYGLAAPVVLVAVGVAVYVLSPWYGGNSGGRGPSAVGAATIAAEGLRIDPEVQVKDLLATSPKQSLANQHFYFGLTELELEMPPDYLSQYIKYEEGLAHVLISYNPHQRTAIKLVSVNGEVKEEDKEEIAQALFGLPAAELQEIDFDPEEKKPDGLEEIARFAYNHGERLIFVAAFKEIGGDRTYIASFECTLSWWREHPRYVEMLYDSLRKKPAAKIR